MSPQTMHGPLRCLATMVIALGALAAGCGGPADTSDAGSGTLVLAAITQVDGTGQTYGFGATRMGGAWTPVAALGTASTSVPGGVTPLSDGRVLFAVGGGSEFVFQSAMWAAGTWSPLETMRSFTPEVLTAPVASGRGAIVAVQDVRGTGLATFDGTTSMWSHSDVMAVIDAAPVLAVTSAGAPIILGRGGTATNYVWSLRTGDQWSAATPIPGISPPDDMFTGSGFASTAAVLRPGSDQLVATFTGPGVGRGYPPSLVAATFTAGAWSSPTQVGQNLAPEVDHPAVLAPLSGGRVASAYMTGSRAVQVGFFSGTAWSTFRAVPGVMVSLQGRPLAITQGTERGVVLELVYIDAMNHLEHTRLTDEAAWTWSTPTVIDGAHPYAYVSLAAP